MNLKEYIKHIKSICKQGTLRHKNVILDETFQKELLEIIKCYEQLQQENEKLHHYKTLYQSLKRQKEELRDYLAKEISDGRSEDNAWLMGVYDEDKNILEKLEELEGVSNDKIN